VIELDLDRETLDSLGMRIADDEWDWRRLPEMSDHAKAGTDWAGPLRQGNAQAVTRRRRLRQLTLASQLLQIWKAARAAGVHVAVTAEAGKLTATPVIGAAVANSDNNVNEWDRDLGTNPPEIRQ
jgi:hypothetical protein